MKYRHWIQVDESSLPQAAYRSICDLVRSAVTERGFRAEIDSDQPDGGALLREIVAICQQHGLNRAMFSGTNRYGHDAVRLYGAADLLNAEFLLLMRPQQIQRKSERDERGRLFLDATPPSELGRVWPNWIVVSDRVRRLLESGAFSGPQFSDVVMKEQSEDSGRGPFWELKSSVILPAMANFDRFIHPGMKEVEPFQGDYSRIVMIADPPFRIGEIHYRRADLNQVGTFDIAQTFEKYIEPHPALVISQRFYRYCLDHKLGIEAQPVRVDEY